MEKLSAGQRRRTDPDKTARFSTWLARTYDSNFDVLLVASPTKVAWAYQFTHTLKVLEISGKRRAVVVARQPDGRAPPRFTTLPAPVHGTRGMGGRSPQAGQWRDCKADRWASDGPSGVASVEGILAACKIELDLSEKVIYISDRINSQKGM